MCRAFSIIVEKQGKAHWKAGIDSHDDLIKLSGTADNTTDPQLMSFCRVKIVPDNNQKYPYLYPELPWKLTIDEQVRPEWFMKFHEGKAWDCFKEWKSQIYSSFNYTEALNPIRAFVGDSVWGYISSLFPNIKSCKYAEKLGEQPFRSCITLWKRGLVPSFDGTLWRLHSRPKADVVWQGRL